MPDTVSAEPDLQLVEPPLDWKDASVRSYWRDLNIAATLGCNKRFPNARYWHPVVFLTALLKHARQDVFIFSGALGSRSPARNIPPPDRTRPSPEEDLPTVRTARPPGTYTDQYVIAQAIEFLGRPRSRLRILLQKRLDDLHEHPLVLSIENSNAVRGEFSVALAGERLAPAGTCHFMVGDRASYRLETDQDGQRAIANFNEPAQAELLADLFEADFEDATRDPARLLFQRNSG